MDDIYLDYLAHHGILGMKWGIRRFQDYGHGGYDPKHKGLFKGRRKSKTSTSKSVVKKGKTGGQLTDEQKARIKKAAIVGAAVAGTALAAYGTYKVSKYVGGKKLAKSIAESGPTILNKNTGQKFAGDATDLGSGYVKTNVADSVKQSVNSTTKNKTKDAIKAMTDEEHFKVINPTHNQHNCKDVSDAYARRKMYGENVIAGEKTVSGNLHDYIEHHYGSSKDVHVTDGDSTVIRERVEKHILKNSKSGDIGSVGIEFDKKYIKPGSEESGHVFNWENVDGRIEWKDFQGDNRGNVKKNPADWFSFKDPGRECEWVNYADLGTRK